MQNREIVAFQPVPVGDSKWNREATTDLLYLFLEVNSRFLTIGVDKHRETYCKR